MNLFNLLKQLVITSRPIGWFLFSSCFTIGYIYSGSQISTIFLLNLIAYTFPASFLVHGLNDVADFEFDKLNPRKKHWLTGGVLDKKYHKISWILFAVAAMLLLSFPIFLKNLEMFVLVSIAIFLAWAYSFKPLRLKSRPFLELFTCLVGAWLIVMIGYNYNGSTVEFIQQFSLARIIAVSGFILGTSILSYLADYEADKLVGEKNTIQFLGPQLSLILALVFFTLSAFLFQSPFLKFGLIIPILLVVATIFKFVTYNLLYKSGLIYLIILVVSFIVFYGLK